MRLLLAGTALLMNALDNLTTFTCLHQQIQDVELYEANPIAAWTFGTIGLVPGLVLEMILTAATIALLVYLRSINGTVRTTLLAAMVLFSTFAVVNNLNVIQAAGLAFPLFGW